MKTVAIIPCRWGSGRFPGKSIKILNHKPVLKHVYDRCLSSKMFDEIYVATDDERIREIAELHGIKTLMTGDCLTGTDRVAEAVKQIECDYVVNVQGDEVFIEIDDIIAISKRIQEFDKDEIHVVNSYSEIKTPSAVLSPNVIKTTIDKNGYVISYSRMPFPYPKTGASEYVYKKQLGMYGYTVPALEFFVNTPQGEIERSEEIELYRFVENTHRIAMVKGVGTALAIDTPNDLEQAEKIINQLQWSMMQ